MGLIRKLLEVEASIVSQAELLLKPLGTYGVDSLEYAARAYDLAAELIRNSGVDAKLLESARTKLKAVDSDKDLALLNAYIHDQNTGSVPKPIREAGDAWIKTWGRHSQVVAFALVRRHFRRGVSEIYRLHITSAAGRLRQQVEAAALIELFEDRPRQGMNWMDHTKDHTKQYWALQGDIKAILASRNLLFAYNHGSAVGMHPSFASAVHTLSFDPTPSSLEITLPDEDFDPADPFTFELAVAFFLRSQQRIFQAIVTVFPELQATSMTDLLQSLYAAVDNVWWVLARRHESRVKDLYQRFEKSEG